MAGGDENGKKMNYLAIIGVLLIAISSALIVSHYMTTTPITPPTTPTPTPPYATPTPPPYHPTPTPYPIGRLEYVKTTFSNSTSGSHIWVKYGDRVKVYVTVHAVGGAVSGWLKVTIRADYSWSFDKDYTTFTKYISLSPNEFKTIYVGSFVAKNVTGEDNFREYFVKIWFNGENIYDPKDPNTREWVKVYMPSTPPKPTPTPSPTPYPPTLGQPKYLGTYFQADQGHT